MRLKVINHQFSVCQIDSVSQVNFDDAFCFVGKTDDELSLVCSEKFVPLNAIKREDGWVCLKVEGVLDFSLVGILAEIATILAEETISVFVVSTYNTDYILIKETEKCNAIAALQTHGYIFDQETDQ